MLGVSWPSWGAQGPRAAVSLACCAKQQEIMEAKPLARFTCVQHCCSREGCMWVQHCCSLKGRPTHSCLQGAEAANKEANATLNNVRQAMGFVAKPL